MKKLIMLVSLPVFIGLLFCYHGAFAEHTGPGKYNNEDLNKYETPGSTDEKTAPQAPAKTPDEKEGEGVEPQDRDEWCRRGTPFVKAISEAQNELAEINSGLTEEGQEVLSESRKEARLESATRKLNEAQKALNDLEDEAHEKGVPVGWVRCNFN